MRTQLTQPVQSSSSLIQPGSEHWCELAGIEFYVDDPYESLDEDMLSVYEPLTEDEEYWKGQEEYEMFLNSSLAMDA